MTAHDEALREVESTMDGESRQGSSMHCVAAMSSSAGDGLGLEITGSPQDKSFSI